MPSSLPPDLRRALISLAERLDGAGVAWVVGGSTARALLGFAVTPHDIDFEVAERDVPAAAAALGLEAVPSHDERVSSIRARARFDGVEVDLTGGLALRGAAGMLMADFVMVRRAARRVSVAGRTVVVAPVEEQIARATVLDDTQRLERIAREAPAGFVPDAGYVSARLAALSAAR